VDDGGALVDDDGEVAAAVETEEEAPNGTSDAARTDRKAKSSAVEPRHERRVLRRTGERCRGRAPGASPSFLLKGGLPHVPVRTVMMVAIRLLLLSMMQDGRSPTSDRKERER
jgi:hypothetical protein